jgi:uncharacterized membrane protein YfcA
LLQGRQIELVVTGLFVIGGLIGLFAGRLMSRRAPAILLQKIFATSMVIIALATLFLNYWGGETGRLNFLNKAGDTTSSRMA